MHTQDMAQAGVQQMSPVLCLSTTVMQHRSGVLSLQDVHSLYVHSNASKLPIRALACNVAAT